MTIVKLKVDKRSHRVRSTDGISVLDQDRPSDGNDKGGRAENGAVPKRGEGAGKRRERRRGERERRTKGKGERVHKVRL